MTTKKIMFFSGYYLPFLGGIETYTHRLVSILKKMDYEIVIVSSNFAKESDSWLSSEGIKRYLLPIYKVFGYRRYPILKKNKKFRIILEQIKAEKPDVIICNTRFQLPTFVGVKIGKQFEIPTYVVEHGSSPLTVANPFMNIVVHIAEKVLLYRLKRYSVKYIGAGRAACARLQNLGIKPSSSWPNMIDCNTHIQNRRDDKKVVIAFVGRIILGKGIAVLLEAFQQLAIVDSTQVELLIIGDGPDLPHLRQKYQQKNIYFLGRLSAEEVIKYDEIIDILVIPTIDYPDGINGVVLEGGLAGCILVATRTLGISEIIRDGENGLYVKTNDIEDLKETLKNIISDKKKFFPLGRKLQKDIFERYSSEIVAQQLIQDVFGDNK